MSVRQAARLVVGRPAVSAVADVRAGDLIAPHLYDLSFNGVNQYASIPHSDSLYLSGDFTVMFWASLETPYIIWAGVVDKGRNTYSDFWSLTIRELYGVGFGIGFTDGTSLERNFPLVKLREWHLYCGGVEGSSMFMSIDGGSKVYYSFTKERRIGTRPIAIGCRSVASDFSAVRVAQLLVYRRPLSSVEVQQIYSSRVVNASGLWLFIDPTFFDGTKYVDLSGSGNDAYPYNAPSRVPAERSFVHVVRSRYSDGVARVAVPPRCSFVIDGARRVNESSSPVFVPVSVGRHLFAFESLNAEPWLVLKAPERVVPASRTVSL